MLYNLTAICCNTHELTAECTKRYHNICFKQGKQKLRDLCSSPDVSRWPN